MEKKRVLYVDDEEANLFLFELQMGRFFAVSTAISGKDALHKLATEQGAYDFIISDIKMPAMDGFEFLDEARKQYPDIPRYFLTAHYENERIRTSLDSGLIDNWFTKPLIPQNIASKLM